MTTKKILSIPDDERKLRTKSQEVINITPEILKIVEDLLDTLKTSERPGVGLAAPQIGQPFRIVVIESEGYQRENGEIIDKIPRTVLINPEIVKSSKEKIEIEEGCLSVPDIMGLVNRPKKIKLTAIDIKGKKICINTSGFLARVLQHELDHLNGILFIDHIDDKTKIRHIQTEE